MDKEILGRLMDSSTKCLDSNLANFNLVWLDVANGHVQDLADHIVVELLIDDKLQELTHKSKCVDSCKSE